MNELQTCGKSCDQESEFSEDPMEEQMREQVDVPDGPSCGPSRNPIGRAWLNISGGIEAWMSRNL